MTEQRKPELVQELERYGGQVVSVEQRDVLLPLRAALADVPDS